MIVFDDLVILTAWNMNFARKICCYHLKRRFKGFGSVKTMWNKLLFKSFQVQQCTMVTTIHYNSMNIVVLCVTWNMKKKDKKRVDIVLKKKNISVQLLIAEHNVRYANFIFFKYKYITTDSEHKVFCRWKFYTHLNCTHIDYWQFFYFQLSMT